MAQFGSALDWGSRGRGFKSRQPDSDQDRVIGPDFLFVGVCFACALRASARNIAAATCSYSFCMKIYTVFQISVTI